MAMMAWVVNLRSKGEPFVQRYSKIPENRRKEKSGDVSSGGSQFLKVVEP